MPHSSSIYGRLRRATEAARAVLLSTEYAEQVVRLSLVSQVAQSYFDLRNLDLQLDITRGTLASRQEALRLVTKRFEATRKIREQQAAQDRQVQALQRTLRLATLRYENGYSSFLEVLDAQRSLFSAELQQVQLQRARLGAIVNLYKALGGGWVP
jgi:outer membrane protein TolC